MLITEVIEQLSEYYPLQPVNTEGDISSTWFVPPEVQLPLTLVWNNSAGNLSAVCALGIFPQEINSKVPLELLTINLLMAIRGGPRFSYSRSSKMLTLINNISADVIASRNIYQVRDEINHLITKGNEILIHLENKGIKLSNNQD